VAQWEAFQGAVTSKRVFFHDDTSLPRQLFFPVFYSCRMWPCADVSQGLHKSAVRIDAN
jgi:hypothetical protein